MKADGCVLIIFTKAPVPGRVNRRLIPVLGEEAAAELYLELLRRTLTTAAAASVNNIELHCTPGIDHPGLVALADEFRISLRPQRGADLGERMRNALHDALANHDAAVLAGCDIPELSTNDLETACTQLCSGCDAVLGPAEDGGYYLIGLSRGCPGLFNGISWGKDGVLAQTREHLRYYGLKWSELPEHWDIDRPQDLLRYREHFETRINLAGKY